MPLDPSKTKAAFSRNVSELMHSGRPQNQALAIAYRIKRGKADGGEVTDTFNDRWADMPAPERTTTSPLSQALRINPLTAGFMKLGDLTTDPKTGERYQLWPEQMARSAATLPGDVYSGKVPMNLGLRREDFTDIPQERGPSPTMVGSVLGLREGPELGPSSKLIERAQDLSGVMGGGSFSSAPGAVSMGSGPVRRAVAHAAEQQRKYPLASRDNWYGEANYENTGGKMQAMSPDEFLAESRPLKIDEVSRENIDDLKRHILEGKDLDPLQLYKNGKEDGRHRAIAAKELGIQEVPVINFRDALLSDTSANAPISALAKGQHFYSATERAIAHAKMDKASPEQWQGYLRNQPGVKQEELGLIGTPEGKQITKQEMLQHAQEVNPKIEEVWRGVSKEQINPKEFYERRMEADNPPWRVPDWEQLSQRERQHWADEAEGASESPTKFHSPDLVLPGGTNYRELLLKLPDKTKESYARNIQLGRQTADAMAEWKRMAEENPPGDPGTLAAYQRVAELRRQRDRSTEELKNLQGQQFTQSHWTEPDVLAHARMNDREIPGVGRTLHAEELQSDWHQKGREKGYRVSETEKARMEKELENIQAERVKLVASSNITDRARYAELNQREGELTDRYNATVHDAIPDAPFKKSWPDLLLKRLIKEAADNGYDAISWTPGEAQAARYDLSKEVKRVYYIPETKTLRAKDHFGGTIIDEVVPQEKVQDYIGKEAAEKLFKAPIKEVWRDSNQSLKGHDISGLDLKVGGEGMKAFYDKMLVDKANAIGKKFGTKVEEKEMWPEGNIEHLPVDALNPDGSISVPVLRISPAMREKISKEGFSLFTDTSSTGAPVSALAKQAPTTEQAVAHSTGGSVSHSQQKWDNLANEYDRRKSEGGRISQAQNLMRSRYGEGGRVSVRPLPPNPLAVDAGIGMVGLRRGPMVATTGDRLDPKNDDLQVDYNFGRTLRGIAHPRVNAEAFEEAVRNMPVSTNIEDRRGQEQPDQIGKLMDRLGFAEGGNVMPQGISMPFPMANKRAHSGMIHSSVPGRTDKIDMGVKGSSYVIPSDVVSGIGQGNSQAGASALDKMFNSGPYGTKVKSAKAIRQRFAEGGDVGEEPVDIVAAGGEYVVDPSIVAQIGGGDMEHGHNVLDLMVKHIRKKTIAQLKKLPGPKAG